MASPQNEMGGVGVLEELHGELQCGVCLRHVSDPRLLSCGHNHCFTCLRSWYFSCLKTALAEVAAGTRANFVSSAQGIRDAPLECPTCRARTVVDPELEDLGLRRHSSLANVVNIVRRRQAAAVGTTPGNSSSSSSGSGSGSGPGPICEHCGSSGLVDLCELCSTFLCVPCRGDGDAHAHPRPETCSGLFLIRPRSGTGRRYVVAHLPGGTAFPFAMTADDAEARALRDGKLGRWVAAQVGKGSGVEVEGIDMRPRWCALLIRRVRMRAKYSLGESALAQRARSLGSGDFEDGPDTPGGGGGLETKDLRLHEMFLVRRCNTTELSPRQASMVEAELYSLLGASHHAQPVGVGGNSAPGTPDQGGSNNADESGHGHQHGSTPSSASRRRVRAPSNFDEDEAEMAGYHFVDLPASTEFGAVPTLPRTCSPTDDTSLMSRAYVVSKIAHKHRKELSRAGDDQSRARGNANTTNTSSVNDDVDGGGNNDNNANDETNNDLGDADTSNNNNNSNFNASNASNASIDADAEGDGAVNNQPPNVGSPFSTPGQRDRHRNSVAADHPRRSSHNTEDREFDVTDLEYTCKLKRTIEVLIPLYVGTIRLRGAAPTSDRGGATHRFDVVVHAYTGKVAFDLAGPKDSVSHGDDAGIASGAGADPERGGADNNNAPGGRNHHQDPAADRADIDNRHNNRNGRGGGPAVPIAERVGPALRPYAQDIAAVVGVVSAIVPVLVADIRVKLAFVLVTLATFFFLLKYPEWFAPADRHGGADGEPGGDPDAPANQAPPVAMGGQPHQVAYNRGRNRR